MSIEALTPFWTRVARGEVDLSVYSDDEILEGKIRMADGRLLPEPPEYPEVFVREQDRRARKKAQRKIREGFLDALEVYEDILNDDTVEPKDRLRAGEFFTNRFLGKEPTTLVHRHEDDGQSAREKLLAKLLAARQGVVVEDLPPDVVEGELVATVEEDLEDLL